MIKALQFFGLLLLASNAFGGEVEDILKKMRAEFSEAKRIEYTSTYELFKGHKSAEVNLSYTGFLCRNGKEVYQKINNTEFIYGSDFFLKINHNEQALVLGLAQDNINQEIDMATLFEHCVKKTAVDKGSYYAITLEYKYGSPTPFGVVKMRIDKNSYHLLQLDLYYRNSQDFSTVQGKRDMAQPHLRIKFGEIKVGGTPKDELFEYSNYIETKKNMLHPTGECKGYTLIDNRI